MSVNTFLVHLSLKYIKRNYKLVSGVSKWMYHELIKFNYKESKFSRSLDKKDIEIIKTLINFNRNKNLLTKHLISYCSIEYLDIIKSFLDNGADIHDMHDHALMSACFFHQLDIIKLLLDNEANIHALDDKAFKLACRYGYLDVVKLLVENGANIHAESDAGILYADQCNHFEVVKFLKSLP